jgi:hypothetical protein
MNTRAWAAAGAVLAIASAPRPALADEPPPLPSATRIGLVYTRGPGAERCPDEDALKRALAAQMGSRFDFHGGPSDGEPKLEVTIRREGWRHAGTWLLRDGKGAITWQHVEVKDAHCAQIVTTAAATIAIQMDPAVFVPAPAPPAPPEVPAPALLPSPPPAPPAPTAPPAPPPAPAPRPGIWEGPAGIGRIVAFALAGTGIAIGTGLAAAAQSKANDVHQLQAALQRTGGPAACNPAGASAPVGCGPLLTLLRTHDVYAAGAIGTMATAGAIGIGALVSIPIVRTPSRTVELQAALPGALALKGAW